MADPNIHHPEWDFDEPRPPLRARASRVAARAGARDLGATLYELDPGGAASPYHLHHGNEELLVVLSGRPVLRTPEGQRELEPGAVVAFLPGPEGAHRVLNRSDERARVLIVSTMRFPELAEHGDTGTTLAITGPESARAFTAAGEKPVLDAVIMALEAAATVEGDAPA